MSRSIHPVPVRTALAVTALAAVALTACTSSGGVDGASSAPASSASSSPGSSSAAPTPPTTTQTVTKTAPNSSRSSDSDEGGGNSGSGGTRLADCAESQLRASIDPRPVSGSSTHGDYARIVDFTNTSNSSCLIRGYPGAAITYTDGQQVRQATRTIRGRLLGLPTSQHTLPIVTLEPGAVASAGIEGVNQKETGAAQAGCGGFYPGIVVTPPNTRTPVPFDVRWPKCFSFTVHPTNIEKNPPN